MARKGRAAGAGEAARRAAGREAAVTMAAAWAAAAWVAGRVERVAERGVARAVVVMAG